MKYRHRHLFAWATKWYSGNKVARCEYCDHALYTKVVVL